MRGLPSLVGAALLVCSPATAGEIAELGCMQNSYSASEKGQLDSLMAEYQSGGPNRSEAFNAIFELVSKGLEICTAQHEWTDRESTSALSYESDRLALNGLLRQGMLDPGVTAKVDTALAVGNRTDLWDAVAYQGLAGHTGAEIDRFVAELGFASDTAKAQQVRNYLKILSGLRASTRTFTMR
ncbi:hypothetical protein [Porphyrobacter sp. AAP82]|uniref:hypothetical protein n=1 Tax=Porphyrobacter sp. AAP82 TaxID=1248917 RepID=UPI00035F8F26|nr:hypothetical protein [Porphyrobacter sp. AAP82]